MTTPAQLKSSRKGLLNGYENSTGARMSCAASVVFMLNTVGHIGITLLEKKLIGAKYMPMLSPKTTAMQSKSTQAMRK